MGAPPPPPQAAPEEPAGGGLVSAEEWASAHPGPVSVKVQVPQDEGNAKFNFNGQLLSLDGVAMNSTVKDIKERLQEMLGGLAANKLKLTSQKLGVLKDQQTLASYNFSDGELLYVATKERGGRK